VLPYKSAEETLDNLGLPPNRQPGNMGFLVHETDGRFHPPRKAAADTRKIAPFARELRGDVRLLVSCRKLLEQKTLSGGVLSHLNIHN
jgi:hypothetical protein